MAIGLALAAKRTLDAVGAAAIPRIARVAVDWRVVGFMLALSFVATVLSSLAPGLHALRLNTVDGLNDGGRSVSAGRGRLSVRAFLVVSQLSFGMLLLPEPDCSDGRSSRCEISIWGFEPNHVLTARIALPTTRYAKADDVNVYMETMTARLRQVPGVTAAGLVRVLPLAQTIGYWPVTVEGYSPSPGERPAGDWQAATPGALEALGEHLVRGRFFTERDTAAAPIVALVNETMARMYWPGRDPVGHRIRFSNDEPLVWATVVGVVGDVHHNGVITAIKTKFYLPYAQFVAATGDKPLTDGTVVLRADGDPLSQVVSPRSAAKAVDRSVPVSAIRPMTDVVDAALTTPRLTSLVMTGFTAVALLLSALGLFGLLGVSGRPAHAGNWHPPGDGRPIGRHGTDGLDARPPRRRPGSVDRDGVLRRRRARPFEPSLWRPTVRSGDVGARVWCIARRDDRRLVDPRLARLSDRSGSRVEESLNPSSHVTGWCLRLAHQKRDLRLWRHLRFHVRGGREPLLRLTESNCECPSTA